MKETQTAQGGDADQTSLVFQSGYELLTTPNLNKGTAFTNRERLEFDLHGLLPSHISTLDEQIERRLIAPTSVRSGSADRVVFPVPDRPKKIAASHCEPTFAEQCIGKTALAGRK